MTRLLSARSVKAFRKKIYDHYARYRRDLPWRKRPTPYRVLISEIMLQQTQVGRVIDKFPQFLAAFPDFPALSGAPVRKLMAVWSGMGYNRRALALRALARAVVQEYGGRLPRDMRKLLALPGIGSYTAGALMAFAFNSPVVFLDTNIRRVYLHEFFSERNGIRDDELAPLIEQTMDARNPRKWYNALMDYGAMLKQKVVNPNRRSAHYSRQGRFPGSDRQVRGTIIRILLKEAPLTGSRIAALSGVDLPRIRENLSRLEKEGFITKKGRRYEFREMSSS